MGGRCDERVYNGDQWNRIHGHICRNRATVKLVALYGGVDRDVCRTHARKLVRQGNYKEATR